MLVPDLLGTNPEFLTSEARLVNITHGYWVTSNELLRIYMLLFPQKIPTGVLHDIPDVTLILRIRDMKLRRSGIIWVGNSRWGSNYGYMDHKGYEEVVKPLLGRNIPLTPFRIRDSSKGRTPNEQVLREIAESEILIQASLHEGTGLPLLEALGVGTVPITSDVGIANEVLTGELKHLIIERSADSFEQKIRELGASAHHLSNLCFSAFDFYIEKASRETIKWDRRETRFDKYRSNFLVAAKIRLIWIYRFLLSKRNR
jgi:glycosyltransferase involved in cell wall biosynthesis